MASALLGCLMAAVTLLVVVTSGCAGYKLGPTNGQPAGARSIQVNPFRNQTEEPQLAQPFTNALRKRLQQDGTYRLATQNDGDVLVNVTLLNYRRSAVSFQPNDIITPRDMDAVIIARVVAEERGTGKVLVDKEVKSRTSIRVGADLTLAERQSMPVLAEELARNIASVLVDGTW